MRTIIVHFLDKEGKPIEGFECVEVSCSATGSFTIPFEILSQLPKDAHARFEYAGIEDDPDDYEGKW